MLYSCGVLWAGNIFPDVTDLKSQRDILSNKQQDVATMP
jgi:hypothetical protein